MHGFKGFGGAMAEYMLLPARSKIHVVPKGINPAHAAFAEPLACSLHAVEQADLKFKDTVGKSLCHLSGLLAPRSNANATLLQSSPDVVL